MSKPDDRRLDAYLEGELSPQEQRALAQAVLDDPELFDQLASAAAVNATAAHEGAVVGARSNKPHLGWMLTGATAAVATIVAVVSIDRQESTPAPTPTTASVPSSSATQPTTPSATAAIQPVLLTARLGDRARQPSSEFRSAADTSRAPKSSGVVVGIEDGEVTIDLGSLDGLAKGAEVQVVRPGATARSRLTIATVFRERSRGRVASPNAAQVGDRIEVSPNLQLSAVMEHALSRIAAGDADAVRTMARQAVTISTNVSGPDGADAMNELAAVLINDRDYAEAETLLRRAQMNAIGLTAVRVANNLGALAALQGDRAVAESMYRSALTMAGTVPESESASRSIEKNLQDLGAVR